MEQQYIWQNNVMVDYDSATTHVMTHGLHYGTSVFEGIRAYEAINGDTVIICLKEHVDRLFYSAHALGMNIPYSQDQICQAIIDTIKQNNLRDCYVRPLVYYGKTTIRVVPVEGTPVDTIIACYKLKKYLKRDMLNVKISDMIRIHPKSTNVEAKIGGHYVNCLQALLAIKDTHYDEVIMLDYEGNVSEASAANIFMVKGNKVYTAERGTILNGITRKIMMNLILQEGYELIETTFKPESLFDADEIIFCGTAVEVCGVASINDTLIADGNRGQLTRKLTNAYKRICSGDYPEYEKLLTRIKW